MRLPVAVGSAGSPTPPGRYFVTDTVPFDPSGPLGAFAFGISGIQPNLPPGWYGADQLAIHGTNDPGSIGQPVTAGCLRVTNEVTEKLKPILQLGTPVTFKR
jgi:lipoprotein-anchoring transpeptidase ErfK/SrfK